MAWFNRHQRFRQRLSAYIDGELTARDKRTLELHLSTCLPCQQELAELRSTVMALGELREVEPPRSFALTPEQAFRPEPRPAFAPAPALRNGFAMAGAACALVLAVVLVADSEDMDGGGDRALQFHESGASLEAQGVQDASALRETEPEMQATGAGVPAVTPGGARGIGGAAGGAASGVASTPTQTAAPAEEQPLAVVPTTRAGEEESDRPPAERPRGAAAEARAEPTDDGLSGIEILEVVLAALVGLAIGGTVVLGFAARRR